LVDQMDHNEHKLQNACRYDKSKEKYLNHQLSNTVIICEQIIVLVRELKGFLIYLEMDREPLHVSHGLKNQRSFQQRGREI